VGHAQVSRVNTRFKDWGLEVCGWGSVTQFLKFLLVQARFKLCGAGWERAKVFNLRKTLVCTNFQLKSSYDVTVVCFHIYLSVFFREV